MYPHVPTALLPPSGITYGLDPADLYNITEGKMSKVCLGDLKFSKLSFFSSSVIEHSAYRMLNVMGLEFHLRQLGKINAFVLGLC